MYTIKLEYATRNRIDQFVNDQRYEDVMTQTACTQLLLRHNIHTTQPTATTIVFESDRDRTLALLQLQNTTAYTARCIE